MVLLIAAVASFLRKPLPTALGSLGTLLLSLTASFFLSVPLSGIAGALLTPPIEKTAANHLADLYSAVHESRGEETVARLDFTDMIAENPAAFQKVLERFGAGIEELRALPEGHTSQDVLHTITKRYIDMTARSAAYALVFLLLFLAGKLIQRRIEFSRPPLSSPKGGRMALSAGCGLLTGLVWVFSLAVIQHWLTPVVGADSFLLSSGTMQSANFYQILNQINPFIRL